MKKIQLSVPQPCHENWAQMTPNEQGRFCASCQKSVIDFSTMSDRALLEFFQKQPTGVCGRFQQEQLHRVLEKPKKPLPYLRYVFQIALPAFLLSMKAATQERRIGKVAVTQAIVQGETAPTEINETPKPTLLATGKVTDEDGLAIPFAVLQAKASNIATRCDGEGRFQITDSQLFQKPILVSAVGYNATEIELQPGTENTISLEPQYNMTKGEVVVVGAVAVTTMEQKSIPIIPKSEKAASPLTIFPNPAPAGTAISLQNQNAPAGTFQVQLHTSSGQLVWTTKTTFTEKQAGTTPVAARNARAVPVDRRTARNRHNVYPKAGRALSASRGF